LLLQNNEPIACVQKQLGHSSIKLTVDTYCHRMPGKNREAMDRLPVPVDCAQ
jgi:integrase